MHIARQALPSAHCHFAFWWWVVFLVVVLSRKKFLERLLAGELLAAGVSGAAIQPADARGFVRVGPPPPVPFVVPAPHPRWAWTRGNWRWDGLRWVWAPGYWAPPPYRDAWVPGHWTHRPGGWVS